MKQLLEQVRAQLGWEGMAGVILLVLAAGFYSAALDPLEQETIFMRARLDAARSNAGMGVRSFGAGDQQRQLGMFLSSLPAEKDVTDILAKIYAIAEATGVGFSQADYHLVSTDKPKIEYEIVFPVQGDYGRVRYFVSRVLAEYPAISLDQLSFQRDRINDAALKADIKMTLFLRPSDLSN